MNDLKDRIVMITGASSGFGKEAAKMCVDLGAKVVLGARREEKLKELCDELGSDFAIYKTTDVTSKDQMHALAQHGIDTFGKIDSLVNNAGVMPLSLLEKGRTDEWDHMIDVNIKGVMNGTLACYKVMVEQGFGHIINTASVAGILPAPFVVSYGMTKHAVVGLSVSLRAQASRYGVRVSALCPGFIETPILEGGKYGRVGPKIVEKLKKRPLPLMAIAPEALVKKVLPQIEKNKGLIVEPLQMKILWWLYRLSPSFVLWLVGKLWRLINKKMNLKS